MNKLLAVLGLGSLFLPACSARRREIGHSSGVIIRCDTAGACREMGSVSTITTYKQVGDSLVVIDEKTSESFHDDFRAAEALVEYMESNGRFDGRRPVVTEEGSCPLDREVQCLETRDSTEDRDRRRTMANQLVVHLRLGSRFENVHKVGGFADDSALALITRTINAQSYTPSLVLLSPSRVVEQKADSASSALGVDTVLFIQLAEIWVDRSCSACSDPIRLGVKEFFITPKKPLDGNPGWVVRTLLEEIAVSIEKIK